MGGKEKRSGETMKMVKKTDVSERLESLRIECERAFTKDEKDPEAVVKKYEIGTISKRKNRKTKTVIVMYKDNNNYILECTGKGVLTWHTCLE